MKILYIARERRDAQLAAAALRGLAPEARLAWAPALAPALRWIHANRDAALILIERELLEDGTGGPFVQDVRAVGLNAPIIVATAEGTNGATKVTGDGIVRSSRLEADLPQVLQSIGRTAASVPSPADGGTRPDQESSAAARSADLEARLAGEAAKRTALETELAAAEARLAEVHGQHQAAMARAARLCKALEDKLQEREAALRDAEARRAADTAVSADLLARRHAEFTATLAQAVAARDALAGQLRAAQASLNELRERWISESAAAADRLTQREAELGALLGEAVAARTALERRLSSATAALEQAAARTRADRAAVEAALERERALAERLDEEVAAHQSARGRAAGELSAAAARSAELDARLAQESAANLALTRALAEAETARKEAERRHAADIASASAHLAAREAELGAHLSAATIARADLEDRLAAGSAALRDAEERADAERAALEAAAVREQDLTARLDGEAAAHRAAHRRMASDLEAAAERQTALEQQLAKATAVFEQQVAESKAALEAALAARASDAEAAAEQLTRREAELIALHQAELGATRADAAAVRSALEQALEQAKGAKEHAEAEARAELGALEERLAQDAAVRLELKEQLAAAEAYRQNIEQRLADAAATIAQVNQARAAESETAASHLAAREAALNASLSAVHAARADLEEQLAKARAAARRSQDRAAAELDEARQREAALEARRRRLVLLAAANRRRARTGRAAIEAVLERERGDHLHAQHALEEQIAGLERERESLQQSVASIQRAFARVQDTLKAEREQSERDRADSESHVHRLSTEHDRTRQTLEQLQSAHGALEQVSARIEAERSRLEQLVAQRDAALETQTARHAEAARAAAAALAELDDTLQRAVEDGRREIAALGRELDACRQELQASRSDADALRREAGRVPELVRQLDERGREIHRQFELAPFGLCRCSRDGSIVKANRAFVRLLGYRNADELQRLDFAAAIFESPADLRWLIEGAASTGTTDWIESAWRTKNRRRLTVRLQLKPAADGSIDIAVEDVTALRSVEERLRQAQRMEAVGRLASEVAATCQSLLRDATEDARQWLTAINGDGSLRRQGELVLGEVTRAASFLQQLAVYGDKQVNTLEPVSVPRVLQDLEPVLKRVAGDDIALVLPKVAPSADLQVDVDAERLERVLVNVANYARERMPHGGRLQFDLTTVLVDSRFLAKHPNVRPGSHVLMTVTEVGRSARQSPAESRGDSPTDATRGTADRPGVDLGALLGLIAGCGGHLWMTADPPGNMVLKIHLPRRVSEDLVARSAPVARGERGRSLARWFRH